MAGRPEEKSKTSIKYGYIERMWLYFFALHPDHSINIITNIQIILDHQIQNSIIKVNLVKIDLR